MCRLHLAHNLYENLVYAKFALRLYGPMSVFLDHVVHVNWEYKTILKKTSFSHSVSVHFSENNKDKKINRYSSAVFPENTTCMTALCPETQTINK